MGNSKYSSAIFQGSYALLLKDRITGNTISGGDSYLSSTSNATKGNIQFGLSGNTYFDEANNRFVSNAGSLTYPTYAFGDGDTGFYESSDDVLRIAFGGVYSWQWSGSYFASSETTGGAYLFERASSSTEPGFAFTGDGNTGIGRAGADQLSLIAGGVEGIRVNSAAAHSVAGIANYETLVISDDDIPNKKYVDDAVAVENLWDRDAVNLVLYPQTNIVDAIVTGANINTITLGGVVVGSTILSVNDGSNNLGGVANVRYSTNSTSAQFSGLKARGTAAAPAIVIDGDVLGQYSGTGFDGVDFAQGGNIQFVADGTPASNSMPTRFMVNLSLDGTQTPANVFRIDNAGRMSSGTEPLPDCSIGGLTLQQNGADDKILTLKSTDIAHGVTVYAETDTYGYMQKMIGATGALEIAGFSSAAGDGRAMRLLAIGTYGQQANTTGAYGCVNIRAAKKNGTNVTTYAAEDNIMTIDNNTTVRWIFKGSGDVRQLAGKSYFYDTMTIGSATANSPGLFDVYKNITGTPNNRGQYIAFSASTFTDNATAGSGTAAIMNFNTISQPSLAASNSSVTTTNASTFYIEGAPFASTNQTITNSWSLWCHTGDVRIDAGLSVGRVTSPAAILDVHQSNASGAEPVVKLEQADVSEEFVRFVGTAAVADLTQSIIDENSVTTATRAGFVKVYVQDDGNQITDQAYFMPIFTLA